jgi:hypothetical protein
MDWAAVDWINVGLLSSFAFLASLFGNILAFNSRLFGAILTAILFAAIFVLAVRADNARGYSSPCSA